jgi:dienelactone hydrolase
MDERVEQVRRLIDPGAGHAFGSDSAQMRNATADAASWRDATAFLDWVLSRG